LNKVISLVNSKLCSICITLALLCIGCTSTVPVHESETLDYKSREITHRNGRVLVSASALSIEESHDIYGLSLDSIGVQPVWIEVENGEDQAYWLMSPGIDPNFFLASEVAEALASTHEDETTEVLEQRFNALAFKNPIPPGMKVSGFVLTNLDKGVKIVQVDLVGDRRHKSFSFFAVVPGFRSDYRERRMLMGDLYGEDEIINYTDEDSFRAALAALPCCVTNKDRTKNGDPLNLVIVGGVEDAFPGFVRRGWHPTEETYFGSLYKMLESVLSGERYPYAPVSPLYLYDRSQDFALQKARDNIHQRNHLRLWLSPMRYHGKLVWVGQISRDIGARFTIHSPYLTTHKIDPDVDEARTALLEDMVYSQSLVQLGLAKGVGAADKDSTRSNLTRDPYYTDGFRGVLIFDVHPTNITDIKLLPWEGRDEGFIKQSIQLEQ
jgi:hypothetical protein